MIVALNARPEAIVEAFRPTCRLRGEASTDVTVLVTVLVVVTVGWVPSAEVPSVLTEMDVVVTYEVDVATVLTAAKRLTDMRTPAMTIVFSSLIVLSELNQTQSLAILCSTLL